MAMTKVEFDKRIKSLKKRGGKISEEFREIVREGIRLYYGETNRNIQVINDLVDTSRVIKGMRVKGLVEYLSQVIPHVNGGQKDDFHFGKMDREAKASMDTTWEQFMEKYPNWDEFTEEKDPTPFELQRFLKTVFHKLEKAHRDGMLDEEGLVKFKAATSKFDFEKEEKEETNVEKALGAANL